LSKLGFSEKQIHQAAILVMGRLLYPGSERGIVLWARKISGLAEILDTNFQHLSHNALYRTSDLLQEYKKEVEAYLTEEERRLYSLNETIVLYDLTNTYLTGRPSKSYKARRGHSKEKRYGCPLLTLALVLDEDDFPKGSRVFPGNVSEPQTLRIILRELKPGDKPTVVIDAGIATEGNLKLITEAEYNYICVARNRPSEIPQDGLSTIKEGKPCIQAKRLDGEGEVLLYCRSSGRAEKEQAMMSLFQRRFEEGLESIASSLTKKGGIKRYHKVMERLGDGPSSANARWGKDELLTVFR